MKTNCEVAIIEITSFRVYILFKRHRYVLCRTRLLFTLKIVGNRNGTAISESQNVMAFVYLTSVTLYFLSISNILSKKQHFELTII